MEYMNSLRASFGHRPLLMVGATVLVLNERRELLMMRRTESGSWGVPGGAMELRETVEQTARRELLEETNLEADQMELFGVFSGPELHYCYPNGDEVYNVSIAYLATQVSGDLKLQDGEHTEFRYFRLSDLPADVSPPVMPILKKLSEAVDR